MIFYIVSKVVKFNNNEGTVEVLISDCEAGNNKLYIASVGIAEIEEDTGEYFDSLPSCLHLPTVRSLLERDFEINQSRYYDIILTPYHKPKAYISYTNNKIVEFTPTMIEESHPYGFIPSDVYRKLIY